MLWSGRSKTLTLPMQRSTSVHFDWVAENDGKARQRQRFFHGRLYAWYRGRVPEGMRVLEWGCGAGKLLKALRPALGLGADISGRMIEHAKLDGLAGCEFRLADVSRDRIEGKFDYVLADHLVGYVDDVQQVFECMLRNAEPRTRLIVTSLNTLWMPVLALASRLGWAVPQPPSNWLATRDLINLLELSGWEVVTTSCEQLPPFRLPGLSALTNRVLVRLPFFRHLGMTVAIIARPRVEQRDGLSCSVVVPMRNEAGNVRPALDRIPVLGAGTELIFVEGNSTDDTWEVLQREVAAYTGPHRVRLIRQPGRGKWDAVRAGFAVAEGDVLVIQDGDLTAPPEDLPKFFEAIVTGRAEFANGSRLVYPMEKQAMQFLNLLGNKFFAMVLSYVLGQPVKDSLCGTKMLLRSDYERLLKRIESFGDFDPFGDFNLLFGASLLDLRIRDIPVRYRDRTYGQTNISRFRHGWLLLRMTWFGLRRLRWR